MHPSLKSSPYSLAENLLRLDLAPTLRGGRRQPVALIPASSRSPLKQFASCALLKAVCVGFLAIGALGWMAMMPALAETRTWSGVNGTLWSEPLNWSPVGAPQDGDSLVFPILADRHYSFNDLYPLRLHSILFNGSFYTLAGASIRLDSDITDSRSGGLPNFVQFDIYFTGDRGAFKEVGSFEAATLYISGHVVLADNQELTLFSSTGNGVANAGLWIEGGIGGIGSVVKLGDGVLYVSGPAAYTYTRGTYFQQGTVHLQNSASVSVPWQLELGNNGVSQATVYCDLAGQLAAGAPVVINDSHLHLNSFDAEIGNLTMQEGATVDGSGLLTLDGNLTSSAGSFNPTVSAKLNLPAGGHTFDVSGSLYAGLEMQAEIAGLGGFSKFGNAALLLERANTFRGEVSVNQGILEPRNIQALGSTSGGTTLSGSGSLTLRNVSIDGERLFVRGNQPVNADTTGSLLFTSGTCSWTGPIELDANLVVWADTLLLRGQISGVGGLDCRNGNIILAGNGANTFTGRTLARCPLLQFDKPSGVNAYAGPLVVGGGAGGPYEARWDNSYQNVGATATLYANGIINLFNHNEDFGPVTFNGGEVDTGTGQFAIYAPLTVNPADSSAVINGYFGLPPGDNRVLIVGDGAADCDLLINAVVFGTPNAYFVKQGPGTMCLTAANTFDTVVLHEEGIIEVNNGSGLGTAAGTIIFDGATLRLNGTGTMPENLEILGAGVGGTHGAVEVTGDSVFLLTGSIFLDAASTFNVVGPNARLTLNGPISGTGPVIKTGAGGLYLGGTTANSYAGDTIVREGSLNLVKSSSVISVPHNLVVGPASAGSPAVARHYQAGGMGGDAVTVNANSLLDLNGYSQILSQLHLTDGGSVQTRGGTLTFSAGGLIAVGSQSILGSHASSSISGNLGLPANDLLTFNVGAHASRPPLLITPELDVSAFIPAPADDPSIVPAGIVKEGLGRMRLGGNNTYKGRTAVNGGTLQVDGAQPQSYAVVNSGARLQGTGTIGPLYMNGSSAVMAPGVGPGILTCGNFDAGGGSGTLQVELNGATPGSGYDQLNVRGTVNLTGISLSPFLNFSSSVTDQFVIINNDGADTVIGAFTGLPQGTNLYIGGQLFQISYTGGTGNDVVLTRLTTPPPPTLAIQHHSSSSFVMSWPANDPAFTVQSSTNLSINAWEPVSPPPVIVGGNFVLTNTPSGPQKFYRLMR